MQGGKLRRIKFKYKGNSLEAVLDRLPTAEVVKEEEDGVVLQAEVFGNGVDNRIDAKIINVKKI